MNEDRAGAIDCLRNGALRQNHAFRRRARGVLLVGRDGLTREEAASICEVSLRTVYNWQAALQTEGIPGLVSAKKPGRTPRLDDTQLARLKEIVTAGPVAAGFESGIWTAKLVQQAIKTEFGEAFSERHVRHLLHKAGLSVQYPKKTGQGGSSSPEEVAG